MRTADNLLTNAAPFEDDFNDGNATPAVAGLQTEPPLRPKVSQGITGAVYTIA